MPTNSTNPNLQCERCGKWRRLITHGKQIMFPYSVDMVGYKGDGTNYSSLCEPCRVEIESTHQPEPPMGREVE